MKIITAAFVLIALLLASPAQAQTKLTKEQGNNYYYNCKAKPDPRMRPESQDAFCACTSVMMMERMTVEDVQVMMGDTPQSRIELNRMLVDVYGPCMNYPVQDLVGMQCLEDKKIDALGSNTPKEELCGCVAETTGAWFVSEGLVLIREVLLKNPNITDPIGPVMETAEFKKQSYNNLTECLTKGH